MGKVKLMKTKRNTKNYTKKWKSNEKKTENDNLKQNRNRKK